MSVRRVQTNLLLQAGRLLLEYNEATDAIHRALQATARRLTTEPCQVNVSYGGVAVSLADEPASFAPVRELRYNTALQARVHEALDQVRQGELDPAAGLVFLNAVEGNTSRHAAWLTAAFLGAAAACLAFILGADANAAGVAGVATGLGLLARRLLARWHVSPLTPPLVAAMIGAVCGGVAIRLDWTQTPDLVLLLPALMLVPGPHFINALYDLLDNYVPMSLARLGLAVGNLLAAGLGVLIGIELTLSTHAIARGSPSTDHLTLLVDVALAGVVTCGFAVFYNTAWKQLWMAMVGGMVGHGLRFVALEAGCWLEAATFLGGFAVGAVSAAMVRSSKTPVAVVAFAGAVTMIPGLSIYRALGGALQLARLGVGVDAETTAATLGNAFQGSLVVTALALGLVVGSRIIMTAARLFGERAQVNDNKPPHHAITSVHRVRSTP